MRTMIAAHGSRSPYEWSPELLDIEVRDGVVVLRGRLDASQAEKAHAAFASIVESVTVDATGLEYISSAGLSVFVKTMLRLHPLGHTLRIINAQPRVHAIFHYANIATHFRFD